MAEWRTMTLRDAGVTLIDCVHKTPPETKEGYPYVAIPQMKDGRIDFRSARRISRNDFIEWTKKARPQKYDVVLSRRTNPGVTATFGDNTEFALGQNLVLLRANGQFVRPNFLRWLVVSPAWWAQIEKYINVGAVFDSLRCGDVPRFELPIPPVSEQAAIADLLNSLADKIDINRQMNETLESMAQAIFKEWFVDFGPVMANEERQELSGNFSNFTDLFPKKLNELGSPYGWQTASLDELAEFLNGLALQKFPPSGNDDLPVIKIAELRNGITSNSGKASKEIPSKYIVEDGDILFSWSGSLMHKFWTEGKGALNQHLFKVIPCGYPKWFVYLWIGHHMPEFQAIAASKATTMGHIQRQHLSQARVIIPSAPVMAAADSILSPLIERIIANALENRTLASLRDLLLPKLMSGELRIRAAEKVVASAL